MPGRSVRSSGIGSSAKGSQQQSGRAQEAFGERSPAHALLCRSRSWTRGSVRVPPSLACPVILWGRSCAQGSLASPPRPAREWGPARTPGAGAGRGVQTVPSPVGLCSPHLAPPVQPHFNETGTERQFRAFPVYRHPHTNTHPFCLQKTLDRSTGCRVRHLLNRQKYRAHVSLQQGQRRVLRGLGFVKSWKTGPVSRRPNSQ